MKLLIWGVHLSVSYLFFLFILFMGFSRQEYWSGSPFPSPVDHILILECEVKWALGSITTNKASGGAGIPAELFQILKVMLWKCCTQYASKLENLAVATGLKKVSFHSNPKKGNAKECSNYHTMALISHASKVMFKILSAICEPWTSRCSSWF